MLYKTVDLLNYCSLTNPVAYTFCRTKNIIQRNKNSTGRSVSQDMDGAQGTYNYEDEGRIFGMGMDVAVIESNGYGEDEKEESMNLVETIQILQKDVQIYKVDNKKLMKSKEQQEGFNIKLMKRLKKIEKKMDKETESRNSRSL
jgi:hypothetical protein